MCNEMPLKYKLKWDSSLSLSHELLITIKVLVRCNKNSFWDRFEYITDNIYIDYFFSLSMQHMLQLITFIVKIINVHTSRGLSWSRLHKLIKSRTLPIYLNIQTMSVYCTFDIDIVYVVHLLFILMSLEERMKKLLYNSYLFKNFR